MTDREFMQTEFSAEEIAEMQKIFAENDTKCMDSAPKAAKMTRKERGDNCWF